MRREGWRRREWQGSGEVELHLGSWGAWEHGLRHRACLPTPKGQPFAPSPMSAIDQLWASLRAGMTFPGRMTAIS